MLVHHLEKLGVFYAIAKEGSFLKASVALRVSQPAVTKSIKVLEDQIGSSLFLRHRRGVELTKSGHLLVQFCESLFLKVRGFEQQVKSQRELSGVVRIGTYETLGELFWPKVLKQAHKFYPDLVVELKTQSMDGIWRDLENGIVDLIVDAEPKTGDHLFSKVLYTDRFGVFCKKGSAFQKHSGTLPTSYVKRAVDRNQTSIEQHIRKMGLPLELLYDVESFTMVRSFILEDVCVGILPLSMAKDSFARGSIVPLAIGNKTPSFGEHRICATWLETSKGEPKIQTLISLLKTCAAVKSDAK